MERMMYMDCRERELMPRTAPYYFQRAHKFSAARSAELWAYRSLCVDRMYKIATITKSSASTAFAAVRMFDRCLIAAAPARITYGIMSMLMVACFDVAHKCMDDEYPIDPEMLFHYAQNEMNEEIVTPSLFSSWIRTSEIGILRATAGQPIMPTPYDYIYEGLPAWSFAEGEGRYASLLCAAMAYTSEATLCSAVEIAVAAVLLSKKIDTRLSADMNAVIQKMDAARINEIQVRMVGSVNRLFSLEYDSGFTRMFADCKQVWQCAQYSECSV